MRFGYEDLEVWNRSVDFAVKVIELVETIDTSAEEIFRDHLPSL